MPGIKVLLVEDDWIIAKEISYNLQDMGFEVAGCIDNAEEALKQIKIIQPDLIILDIDLAGEMTGIELATQLKKEGNIPFIFLTALADSQTVEKAKLAEQEKARLAAEGARQAEQAKAAAAAKAAEPRQEKRGGIRAPVGALIPSGS